MAANGASPRLRSEIHIPQRDGMTSSPSPVDTPKGEPVQVVPLQLRPLQGPSQPTDTLLVIFWSFDSFIFWWYSALKLWFFHLLMIFSFEALLLSSSDDLQLLVILLLMRCFWWTCFWWRHHFKSTRLHEHFLQMLQASFTLLISFLSFVIPEPIL